MWTHAEVTSLLFGLDAWPRDLEQWHKLLRDFLTLQLICMQPEIHILSDDELYFLLKRSGVDCFQTRGLWSATECLGESLLLSLPRDFTFAKDLQKFAMPFWIDYLIWKWTQGQGPIKDIAVDPGLAWLGYYSVGVFGVLVGALGIRTVCLSHFVFWI